MKWLSGLLTGLAICAFFSPLWWIIPPLVSMAIMAWSWNDGVCYGYEEEEPWPPPKKPKENEVLP